MLTKCRDCVRHDILVEAGRGGEGEKKEGRHPDDQSFNFKNLIP